ncbi:hypothetical protein DPMN_011748 [Dreissena polymorpha]|uniref:Uncharacterized protein n=1 Tax=Dreissena polymorpha TaxID=45954 RepID=A0A9D4S0B9_DREPO|nr:hypothetical protein DPMN_011748 [Dreissena polymorpha]
MRGFNIDEGLVQIIQELSTTSADHELREAKRSDQLQILGRNTVQGWYQYH